LLLVKDRARFPETAANDKTWDGRRLTSKENFVGSVKEEPEDFVPYIIISYNDVAFVDDVCFYFVSVSYEKKKLKKLKAKRNDEIPSGKDANRPRPPPDPVSRIFERIGRGGGQTMGTGPRRENDKFGARFSVTAIKEQSWRVDFSKISFRAVRRR